MFINHFKHFTSHNKSDDLVAQFCRAGKSINLMRGDTVIVDVAILSHD